MRQRKYKKLDLLKSRTQECVIIPHERLIARKAKDNQLANMVWFINFEIGLRETTGQPTLDLNDESNRLLLEYQREYKRRGLECN